MTFRFFIFCCALCGGWMALFGWVVGRTLRVDDKIAAAGLQGMYLGLLVSFGLSVIDALWNVSLRQVLTLGMRVLVAVLVGSIGGMIGGMVGQVLFGWKALAFFYIGGWMLTGFLIGASIGVFEVLASYLRQEDPRGAIRKIVRGILGGTMGGGLGAASALLLKSAWSSFFASKPIDELWTPSATGFVVLGLLIGLFIGLAQVILKEAWIKVEIGRRAGREMILSKGETTVGRAESCDIGLFGDMGIEKLHARILRAQDGFLLDDAGTPGGTYLNDQRITGPTPLRTGDGIRVGNALLRFGERRRQAG